MLSQDLSLARTSYEGQTKIQLEAFPNKFENVALTLGKVQDTTKEQMNSCRAAVRDMFVQQLVQLLRKVAYEKICVYR